MFTSKNKSKKIILLILAIILLFGVLIRISLIFSRNIFHDELAYFNIARTYSIKDIILINHWIKDHGIIYYLFLKPFISLTYNIIYLRLTNILLYLISAFVIFLFFKKNNNVLLGLLVVFLYSFHRYFVYINAQISPFNLVLFFSILSIISLYCFLSEEKIEIFHPNLTLFAFSTILGFYSDYSFFYMGFFYFFVLIWAAISKHRSFLLLLNSYLFVLIFVIPGIFQFIHNFNQVAFLFENTYKNQLFSFISFIKELFSVFVLRISPTTSLIFLGCLVYLVIAIKKISNTKTLSVLAKILFSSLLMNTVLIYIFSQHLFNLFIERSFWFFYISLIILVSIITDILLKRNKLVAVIIFGIFCLFGLINFIYPGSTTSDVATELKYNTLIEKLTNEKKTIDTIFLIDRRHAFTVLKDYYFSKIFPKSDKYYPQLNSIRNNLVAIERYKSLQEILQDIRIKESMLNYVLIVLFNPSSVEIEMTKRLQNQNLKFIIYYSKQINPYQAVFIPL